DLAGALRANPAVVAGAALLVAAPLGIVAAAAAWWRSRPLALRRCAVAAVLLAAELWQLGRYALLPG
ncbi:MAG: hypothetical protein ACJ74O_14940, partial [Frankiaceae bacterium]